MAPASLRPRSIRAFSYRFPLAVPVVTSFGRMTDRPAVFIRVEDADGVVGWGEAWSNFPSVGAEHRVRIVNEILAPMICGHDHASPSALFADVSAQVSVLALQSGEAGPFAQSIAGIDLAMWDIAAQHAKLPLWRLLGGQHPTIKVYASGINPSGAVAQAQVAKRRGHTAFKLKIGFDPATDFANLAALTDVAGPGALAADANQAWTVDDAMARADEIDRFGLIWLEEPIRADRPWDEWQRLRAVFATPIAAGENIASVAGFAQVLKDDTLRVVQPDIAKWGGLSATAPIARDIRASGKRFCPHYLGGGIGLLASAHLLAAIGGEGLLEIDSNDNPLRDDFCGPVAKVTNGTVTLTDDAGLGIAPDPASIESWRTA